MMGLTTNTTTAMYQDQTSVSEKNGKSLLGDGGEDQAHDTKWRAADYPLYRDRYRVRDVLQRVLGSLACAFKSNTKYDSPEQDTDVVGLYDGIYRIVNQVHKKVGQYFGDAAWRRYVAGVSVVCESKHDREDVACDHGTGRCQHVTCHIEDNDHLHICLLTFSHMAQSAHNQEEYQNRSDSPQGSDEQISEDGDTSCLWNNKSKDDTNDQSTDDPFYQTDAVPFLKNIFNCLHCTSQILLSATSLSSRFCFPAFGENAIRIIIYPARFVNMKRRINKILANYKHICRKFNET